MDCAPRDDGLGSDHRTCIELLQAAVGSDLHQLAGELDKLASFVEGRGRRDRRRCGCGGSRSQAGRNTGGSSGCSSRPKCSRALDLIPHVLAQPKTTAVSVVMALSTQMLAISWGRAKLDEGLPRGASIAGVLQPVEGDGSVYRQTVGVRRRRLGSCCRTLEPRSARPRARFICSKRILRSRRAGSRPKNNCWLRSYSACVQPKKERCRMSQ
jgi:hypothetical protein